MVKKYVGCCSLGAFNRSCRLFIPVSTAMVVIPARFPPRISVFKRSPINTVSFGEVLLMLRIERMPSGFGLPNIFSGFLFSAVDKNATIAPVPGHN